MYFVDVDFIPKRTRRKKTKRKDVTEYLDKFMASNAKKKKLVFDEDEYVDARSAYGSFYSAMTRSKRKYPIELIVRKNDLYFRRTDI